MHVQLLDHKITSMDTERGGILAMADPNHTIEDAKDPRYLWNANRRILPHDIIVIRHPRHAFYLRLYVVEVDHATASIRYQMLEEHDFRGRPPVTGTIADARIEWGAAHKHRVVSGTTILAKGFETKEEAQKWLEEQRAKSAQPKAA